MSFVLRWSRALLEKLHLTRDRARIDTSDIEAELSTLVANTSIGIGIADESGRIVRTNAAMDRFLGYGPGELVGLNVRDVSHPDDFEVDLRNYQQLKTGDGTAYQIEKRYIKRDGQIVRGRLIASLVRRFADGTTYIMGMVEDITEQQRIKEQLDASLTQLAAVNYRLKLYFERAPLASVVWGSDQIIREWNPAAERMFGYTAAEALGRNVYELTSTPEGLEAVARVREQFLSGGNYPEVSVVKNRRKDGTEIYCEWYFAIVSQFSDALNGVIAFGTDVTARIKDEQERRQLEANLRQAQKMQSLGTLAGGIAHDFNNVLLAISGNTKLVMEELPANHGTMRSLQEISKATTRASAIVNQILMFSRREEQLERVSVRVGPILEDALTLLRATLPARISISTEIRADLPFVHADAGQIHQVLLNLVTNAAHAIGESPGSIQIKAKKVELDGSHRQRLTLARAGEYVCISVTDTGQGMEPEVLERIFEPFFTTKPRGQGTGLGLAVVHGIVRAHDGAIDVRSSRSEGSTFQVYLPTTSAQAQTSVLGIPDEQRGRGQKILYIDDEESLVFLITRVLERLGYRVVGFTDAEAALARFRAAPDAFDAVVTDLSMPRLSGNELAREILALRPQLPVVMTSGYVRADDRASALALGVREVVLKPNSIDALGQVLHRLLNETTQAQPQGD